MELSRESLLEFALVNQCLANKSVLEAVDPASFTNTQFATLVARLKTGGEAGRLDAEQFAKTMGVEVLGSTIPEAVIEQVRVNTQFHRKIKRHRQLAFHLGSKREYLALEAAPPILEVNS